MLHITKKRSNLIISSLFKLYLIVFTFDIFRFALFVKNYIGVCYFILFSKITFFQVLAAGIPYDCISSERGNASGKMFVIGRKEHMRSNTIPCRTPNFIIIGMLRESPIFTVCILLLIKFLLD